MALVSTGGIEPLYSGEQITQRGAAASWASNAANTGGVPATWARGVKSSRLMAVRSSTAALWPCWRAAAAKRSASCRLWPLLAAITSTSVEVGVLMAVAPGWSNWYSQRGRC